MSRTHSDNSHRHHRSLDIYINMGWPYHWLVEVMRPTKGLMDLCNDCFYSGKLVNGPNTELDHPSREMSVAIKKFLFGLYPALEKEPEDKLWPVFLDVDGISKVEESQGSSLVIFHHISVTLDYIVSAVDAGIVQSNQIGIATPYAV